MEEKLTLTVDTTMAPSRDSALLQLPLSVPPPVLLPAAIKQDLTPGTAWGKLFCFIGLLWLCLLCMYFGTAFVCWSCYWNYVYILCDYAWCEQTSSVPLGIVISGTEAGCALNKHSQVNLCHSVYSTTHLLVRRSWLYFLNNCFHLCSQNRTELEIR